jgi:hypothetical protein
VRVEVSRKLIFPVRIAEAALTEHLVACSPLDTIVVWRHN